MAFFDWDDTYSVRIERLDNQHRKLLAMVEEFYRGLKAQSSKESLITLIHELEDYSQYHFQSEETLMEEHGFPGLEKHRAEHVAFIAQINEYRYKYQSGQIILSMEITTFVKDWLINHILKTDKAYSRYLNKRGVM